MSDIEKVEGVDVIHVTEGKTEEEILQKRLKTKASERTVPIHPELVRIGFLEFVKERKAKGDSVRLFPELNASKNGYYSDLFSKWFSRFVRVNVGDDCGARFHDFRHMVRDAFREVGTNVDRVMAIQGWVEGEGVQAQYGKGFKASTLLKEISKVTYPGLDLSHLYRENQD